MSELRRFSNQSQESQGEEEPQLYNQSVDESVMVMMKKTLAKRKRRSEKEYIEDYVRNHILFHGQEPTKEDINSAFISWKNSGKKQRVKRKSEPEMTKEEYFARNIRNSTLLFGEPPTEEELNKDWDRYVYRCQYNALRSDKKKAVFLECMKQVMTARYSPEKIEERRLQKEIEMNKHNIT